MKMKLNFFLKDKVRKKKNKKINFHLFSLCVIYRNNLDNNQQRLRSPKRSAPENEVKANQDDIKYSNAMERMDIYSDSNENAIKIGDDTTDDDDRPPRLPPRPPPRPRNTMNNEAGMIYSSRFFLYFLTFLYTK